MFFQSSAPKNYHVTSPEKWGVGAFSCEKKGGDETARLGERNPFLGEVKGCGNSQEDRIPTVLLSAGVNCEESQESQKKYVFLGGGLKCLGLGSIG